MRVTFVVQRYGPDVIGGAETLCRGTAEALARRGWAVRVMTTTARDYLTWVPTYPVGRTEENGVVVHRHPVDPPDPKLAARLTSLLALGVRDWATERDWVHAQGPVSPRLLAGVTDLPSDEIVVMWTYLYATTQLVAPIVGARGIVVPTAHNEAALRFTATRGVMRSVGGFALLTPEERSLVDDYFGIGDRPAVVVGAALPPSTPTGSTAPPGVTAPYVLYVGRMDPGKGVAQLMSDHAVYRAAGGTADLVYAGPGAAPPGMPTWAKHLGRVDDPTRAALMRHAIAVAMPSTNESYSLVLAEAWQSGTPTLGTGRSAVVAGQTARSGGGLLYVDGPTYARQLTRLEHDPVLRAELGAAGASWAGRQTWERVTDRWDGLLADVAERAATI